MTNARHNQLDEKITENSKAVNEITTNVAHLVQKQAVDNLKQSTQWHDSGLLDNKVKAILRRGQLPQLNKLKQYYVVQSDEDEARYVISQCLVEEYAPISSTIKLLDGPCQDETIETHLIWVFGDGADASKAMDALNAILILQDTEVAKAMGSEMDTESRKSRTEIALPWWAALGAMYQTCHRSPTGNRTPWRPLSNESCREQQKPFSLLPRCMNHTSRMACSRGPTDVCVHCKDCQLCHTCM